MIMRGKILWFLLLLKYIVLFLVCNCFLFIFNLLSFARSPYHSRQPSQDPQPPYRRSAQDLSRETRSPPSDQDPQPPYRRSAQDLSRGTRSPPSYQDPSRDNISPPSSQRVSSPSSASSGSRGERERPGQRYGGPDKPPRDQNENVFHYPGHPPPHRVSS